MASSSISTMSGLSQLGSKHGLAQAHGTVFAISVDLSRLYKYLTFSRCVSPNLRRNARSRGRLTDRALSLKQRASDTPSSLT
jgi:hypothetical protein